MNAADTKNDIALMMKAVFRPAMAVTIPPIDAPMASIADQVALERAFAGTSSSRVVMLGIVAVRDGSKNAVPHVRRADTANAIHTWPGVRTSRSPSTNRPRAT